MKKSRKKIISAITAVCLLCMGAQSLLTVGQAVTNMITTALPEGVNNYNSQSDDAAVQAEIDSLIENEHIQLSDETTQTPLRANSLRETGTDAKFESLKAKYPEEYEIIKDKVPNELYHKNLLEMIDYWYIEDVQEYAETFCKDGIMALKQYHKIKRADKINSEKHGGVSDNEE